MLNLQTQNKLQQLQLSGMAGPPRALATSVSLLRYSRGVARAA